MRKAILLGRELEILMRERQTLLQVVGATAALIASSRQPASAIGAVKPADLVASTINACRTKPCAMRLPR
jgi:hypothetical protein